MQRGGLAGAGGATDKKQAVGFFDGGAQTLQVVGQDTELVERDRFARRQDAHDDVFDAAGRRDGGHAQFDVERAVLFKLDLAVLRFALFRNIKVAHDLQARHHRLPEMRRHFDVGLQAAVNAKPDAGLGLARQRLDVDVRDLLVIGVNDHLVDELDQLVVSGC